VFVVGGNIHFLIARFREQASIAAKAAGFQLQQATSQDEVFDALDFASSFGEKTLVYLPLKEADVALLNHVQSEAGGVFCLICYTDVPLTSTKIKKGPKALLEELHGSLQVSFVTPSTKKDQEAFAARFLKAEVEQLMGWTAEKKKAEGEVISKQLLAAAVKAVGTDVGRLSFEARKFCALARSQGSSKIVPAHITAVARGSGEINLDPLRTALRTKDVKKCAAALYKIRAQSGKQPPTLLLLRGKGSPPDLTLRWLRAAALGKSTAPSELASRLGIPRWMLEKDILPALRKWSASDLKKLIRNLSRADSGVGRGDPSPWVMLEAALLIGCSGSA
jgi:hypothetical protein